MSEYNQELSHILLSSQRAYLENTLGNETWIKVYDYNENSKDSEVFYCGLIDSDSANEALKNPLDWEVHIAGGFPGCVKFGDGRVQYYRFGEATAEPLVFIRDYVGFRDSHAEVSEEFRFFHNLYYHAEKNEFLKFNESGEGEAVVKFHNNAVLLRLREIRQFLAIKESHLVLFFEYHRYASFNFSNLSEEYKRITYLDENTAYEFGVNQIFEHDQPRIVSYLRGKKLIPPYPKSKSCFWPYLERDYQIFQIGEDSDGNPIEFTCDSSKLANYYGRNPDAPNYLTPVYFKRGVLQKYYGDSDRFLITDSLLRCSDSWSLPIDNHHKDVVIVFLGRLGDGLPAEEQKYWKVFNISPSGGLSFTTYSREILGEPFNPQGLDLEFKRLYQELNHKWHKQYSWYLFRNLVFEDSHYLSNLRVPLNNSQSEFDMQILRLTKVMIDSLNEKEIEKLISVSKDNNLKGIDKFSILLEKIGFVNHQELIRLLRNIQAIRSTGVAHLKGKNYSKIARKLNLYDRELQTVFCELLNQLIVLLHQLLEMIDQKA